MLADGALPKRVKINALTKMNLPFTTAHFKNVNHNFVL